jgi:putative endonuclease
MTRAARSGRTGYHAGLAAEEIVASDYARRGHATRDRRWRGSGGEIDLVATDGDGLIFIEVKKAASHDFAAERLSQRQVDRILSSASEYLGAMPRGQLTPCRFDVALVDAVGRIEILENACGF